MKTRTIFTLIALGSVVALVACSSSETDKFGSSDSFCSAKAEAECNGLAKKCGAENDACKTERTGICNTNGAEAANQGRSYRANAAQDCIDSINDTYKNNGNDVTPDGEAETLKVCERVFSGSKTESDTCTNTYECEGALICDKGVCIKEEKVATKAQCNNAGQTCETGAYCAQQGATKFCLEKKNLDEACNDPETPCIESLRCLSQRCVAKVTAGNPCNVDDDCSTAAPYCDPAAKKCRPKYESTSAACKDYGL
jgi:hypothetical protein